MEVEKLLTVQEVSEILGITIHGVYGLVFKKRIPTVKITKRILRFSPKAIAAFIESKSEGVQDRRIINPIPYRPRSQKGRLSSIHINNIIDQAKKEVLR